MLIAPVSWKGLTKHQTEMQIKLLDCKTVENAKRLDLKATSIKGDSATN